MASTEFIAKRIEGKKKEIEKLEKKMQRIQKAKATGWTVNPYLYDEYDEKCTAREIESAREQLAVYEAQLAEAEKKAASRNVPAILEFLEVWKKRVFEFYDAGFVELYKERAKQREISQRAQALPYCSPEREALEEQSDAIRTAVYNKLHGYFRETTKEERQRREFRYVSKVKVRDGEWEHLAEYSHGTYDEAAAKLRKDLEQEAARKYDFIIERTVAITGEITDASALTVGAKGDLNGYIEGKDGKASIKTIGAGGYNIQCYHFRTLIHKM